MSEQGQRDALAVQRAIDECADIPIIHVVRAIAAFTGGRDE